MLTDWGGVLGAQCAAQGAASSAPTRYSVLFLAGEYPPQSGGVGDYTAILAEHLAAQGVQVTVLATAPPRRGTRYAAPLPRSGPGTGNSVLRLVDGWDWRCGRTVRAAVEAVQPDVVHVQYQPAAFGMAAAVCWLPGWVRRRCPGVRTVVTFHDLRVPYLFPKAGPLRGAVRDRLLHGADAAVFTDLADWHAAAAVRPTGRYWVPIGSNLAVAPPAGYDRRRWRATVGADDDTFLIVHLGFLNRSKGLETLLAALVRLHEAGRRPRLLLVGAEAGASDATNQAYAAEIERALAAPAVRDLVHRLPVVPADEASGYLLAADAAAFAFTDGASLRRGSLLAALAHGLPTVSTRLGPPPRAPGFDSPTHQSAVGPAHISSSQRTASETAATSPVLRDEANILLAPVGDAAALAAALARVADDGDLRARLAAGGPALVEALGWPRIAAAHRALYAALRAGGNVLDSGWDGRPMGPPAVVHLPGS